MNKNMTKQIYSELLCAVLEDGKIHRYREIYDYACTKSVGTPFEGQLDLRNFILAFSNRLEQPDFPYMRVRFGYYQKMTPAMICGAVGDQQLNRVYELLDAAITLSKRREMCTPMSLRTPTMTAHQFLKSTKASIESQMIDRLPLCMVG